VSLLFQRAHRSMIGGHHMLGALQITKNVGFMSPTTEAINTREGLRTARGAGNNLGYDPLDFGFWVEEPGLIAPTELIEQEVIYPPPRGLFVAIASSTSGVVEGRDQYVDMTLYQADDVSDSSSFERMPGVPWRRFTRPADLGARAEGLWACVFDLSGSTKEYGVVALRTSLIPTAEEIRTGAVVPDPSQFLAFGGFYFFTA